MITAVVLNPAVDKIYFIDDFEVGELYRVKNVVKSAGGKGINVARVSSMLGEKVSAIGFKAGEAGKWLESEIRKLGIYTNFIGIEGESRTNNNIIDKMNKTETEILEIGPLVNYNELEDFMKLFKGILHKTDVLICSGGIPKGIPEDFYRTIIETAKSSDIKVILDASNNVLREGIRAKPYMVKPNLRELNEYAGKSLESLADIIKVCKKINSEGVEVVVTSMGKDGAVLVSKNFVLHAKSPDVDVVNAIGSGDSFVAGLAVGLSQNIGIVDMLKLGMACAVANTQFVEIGVISVGLVEKYKEEIIIEKLNVLPGTLD